MCSLYINENDTIKQRILDQKETNAIKSFSEWSFHLLMAISSLLFVIPIYYESLVIPFYIVGIVIYVISLIKMLPWAKLNSNHKRKTLKDLYSYQNLSFLSLACLLVATAYFNKPELDSLSIILFFLFMLYLLLNFHLFSRIYKKMAENRFI